MQIVSNGDNLHEKSNPVSWENKKNISKCRRENFTQIANVLRLPFCMAFRVF